jgi:hypothetical protein
MNTVRITDALNMIRKLPKGQIFTVVFNKRSDGSQRTMNCRQNVTKHLKGGELSYSPNEKKLVMVWDLKNNGYRSFPYEGLTELRCQGQVVKVTHPKTEN